MKNNEAKQILDLALHPVRMRILTLLAGSQGLTPQQMADQMSDIPQATLYRHINRLANGELLTVVAERQVRGTVEKVYALNTAYQSQVTSPEEAAEALNQISKEDHLRYFMSFVMTLLDDFSNYLTSTKGSHPDLVADGVGYHKLALFLNDEEFAEFGAALNGTLATYLSLEPTPERRKRLLSVVMMPAVDERAGKNDGSNDLED